MPAVTVRTGDAAAVYARVVRGPSTKVVFQANGHWEVWKLSSIRGEHFFRHFPDQVLGCYDPDSLFDHIAEDMAWFVSRRR